MTRKLLLFAALAVTVAVIRFFLKEWLDALGIPPGVGSMLASLWVLEFVALIAFFRGDTRWLTAASAWLVLAAWCELLVVSGIHLTERTGWDTYYSGPWPSVHERFRTAEAHVRAHLQGFLVRAPLGLLFGTIIWRIRRRTLARWLEPRHKDG